MTKKRKKISKAEEPKVGYGKHEIQVFNSFEEMQKYDDEEIRRQSPVERLKETVDLILRIYGFTRETLRARKPDNTIYIDEAG